jgi:membrane-associated protein
MDWFQRAIDIFLHLDVELNNLAGTMGMWLYLLLFLIVFCETGLVVTPFLPGDSLLFAVGALAARPESPLQVVWLMVLLMVAAVSGDALNYFLGYQIGPRVFTSERSRLFNKKHLLRTQQFYEKYGGKTIILARFIPIIRTFAPFVAGIGKMEYRHFSLYNITGGVAWVVLFLLGGYWFSSFEVVKQYFHLVIVAIIIISVMPAVIEVLLAWRRSKAGQTVPVETP